MTRIDTKWVLLGGLLAGLIINIGETLLNAVVLADEMAAMMERFGLPEMSGGLIGLFVAMGFILGIVGVWLYAAARPRLGAGAGTALKIAAAVWYLSYLMPTVGFWGMGMLDTGTALLVIAWGLVELGAGITAGAWLYREEKEATPEAAAPRPHSTAL